MADTIIGNIPYSQIRQKTYINGTYEDISELGKALEKAGVSFSGRIGCRSAITVEQSDKNKVLEIFEQLKKEKTVVTENRNGIIGNTEYRYIRDKKYINGDTDIMLRVADRLKNENISFSGRTVGDKTTLTVSGQQMQELVNRYVSEEQEGIADPITEYEIRLCSDTDLGKYCISEINSDSGQETSKHTYNGHTAVFDSIDECIAFGELHKMSFINSSEQLDLLRSEENSEKIRRMQELISRIDPTSDHFEFHRDSSVEMSYFNADGGENGQFVIMHIHENDVIGAVEKMADSTDDKLKVFLNSLYENCSTEVIDSDENNFISYAEMFIDEESSVSKCHDGNAGELAAIVDRIIDNFSETRSETLENNISLNKQLEELTKEITEKEKALTAYVKERRYAQAAAAAAELDDLSKQAEKMRTEIQQETITKDDVDILRSITPKRKSVQNMLENEVAKTAKFDKLLGDEMGEKSAYEMRRTNNAWRKDENKTASIIRITPRERPEKITDIRKDKNIEKGIYINKDTGMAIHFGNVAIGEIIAKAIPDDKRNIPVDARLSAIYQMKEIIENSICFDSRVSEYDDITSKNKSPNTLFIHRLYGILKYNNDFYLSNLAVEEMYTKMENGQMEDTHNRVYSLRDIKITPVKLSSLKARTDPQNEFADKDTSSSVTKISIPQLYDFVKAFDGSFFENSSSIGRAEREAEIQAHNEYLKAREEIEKEAQENENTAPTAADLSVGDVILYEGKRREVESINEHSISLKDLDAPDYGGILLGTSDVLAYDGWQQDMENKGFEILDKHITPETKSSSLPKTGDVIAWKEVSNWYKVEGYTDDSIILHAVSSPVNFADITFEVSIDDFLMHNFSYVKEDKTKLLTINRVGDFRELYGNDARIAAEVLDLHLTRKNGKDMCGFPDFKKGEFIQKLQEAGYSVVSGNAPDVSQREEQAIERAAEQKEKPYKPQPAVSLMNDLSETAEQENTEEKPQTVTLEYKGTPEDIQNFKEQALYVGDVTDSGDSIEVYTSDNQKENLDTLARENGLTAADDLSQTELSDNMEESGTDQMSFFEKSTYVSIDEVLRNFVEDINSPVGNSGQKTSKDKNDYSITDEQYGTSGGAKTRFENNAAAIALLKKLESEGRNATPEEQEVLAKYVGWGGIPQVFDSFNNQWSREYAQLKELLTESEYNTARASTMNAHYTSPTIIGAIYTALDNMGFSGGKVLEPAMGIGNFFGAMPEKMRNNSQLAGVELDSITGRIAKQLYQSANIQVTGYEKTSFENNSFDVAVGNVPFGSYKVNDKDYNRLNMNIHDFFFAKSLDKVHAGGIVAFVTSSGTLDKENPSVRKYLAERAELLGAIRLPSNAFKSNAGTEVTTDIIFLQKRDKPVSIEKNTPEWVFKGILDNGIAVNKYFADNPDMILGEMAEGNKLYGSGTMCIPKEGADLKQQLTEAVNKIKGEYRKAEKETERTEEHLQDIVSCPPDAPKFSFIVENDRLYYHEADDTMTAVKGKDSDIARIKEMAALRETVNDLLRLQIENSDGTLEKSISETQHKLNDMYDCFVEKYGRISSKDNQKLFSDDNAYHLIKNLEVFDDDGNFSRKADIFDKITINPQIIIDHCDNANDALILSLAEKVSVDMEYMSELTGKSEDELIAELGDKIYQDPQNGMRWESADEYLTGNIRTKLAAAQEAGLERNIKALEAVMPERIEAADISVKLGASWIDPKYIKQFIVETLKPDFFTRQKLNVVYSEAADKWKIEGYNTTGYHNTLAAETYGTADMNAYEIIEAALNLKKIEIKDRKKDEQGREMRDDKGNYILEVNHRKTTVAQSKKEEIERKFADWIFDDVDRRKALTDLYNEKFNSVRLREYDGSHLNFVGMNNSIELKDHQKNAVARALYSNGNTLLAHEVGAGKSYEMIAIAMEGKRLGLHSKSMIAVPNALTEQLGNEFRKLYPNANVLVATEKDFRKENRRDLFAKIATGDWDAVIVGHTQLDSIHLSDERELQMLNRETETLREALIEAKAASVGGSSFSVKQIERSIKTYEDKITKLLAKTPEDDMLNFESLGIDKLFVDESQNYKNLNVPTKMQNVAGLGGSAAGKSMEMLMKCHYLDEITGGKGTIFASGTPISNSMSEMYSLLRYLQNSKLEELGISSFDRWASVFGETTTSLELSPEGNGKYQSKTRFSKFQNLPELMTLFRECADIKTAESLNLPRPECEVHNVNIPASALQRSLINELGERARLVRSGAVKPNEDNMLVITSDGRKIGLDVRCIDPSLPDDPNSKVNVCVKNVFDIYQKTGDNKGTQLIFCDLATPQAKSNENYFEILRKDENGEFNSIFKGTLGEKDNAERILKNSKGKRLSKAMESIGGISDGDIIMTSRVNYDEQAAYKTAHSVKDGKTAEISTEMWEELHASPVESFKSERRFSVYDDIKQKLVDMGIPEKEIAFIHDADTSQQKQEMFDRMNNGEIRVMIGSTQKCGAGMNAQKRMAALHDLDCPMRPSDMTQRHGRILRQGNSYDKVDIFRYTTDNTFDAYLYQMLENKQKFISQIMTEKTPVRSCEDVDEAVLDYAEVKALCAGNPLIREKIDIETEITKLNVLKSSFLSQKYTMQTKASEIIPREIAQTEKHIEKLQSDLELSAAEKPETNEEGKKYFPVTVGSTVYTDKEEAGAALRQAVLKNGSIIEGKECAVGKYRGFEVSAFFDAFNKKFKICLNGDSKHYGELNMDQNVKASGNIIRMDNVIGNIQAELITEQKKLESLKVDLSEAKTLAEQAFPQESELIAKQKRLDEINILLMQQPGGRGQELYEALAEICPEIQYTDDLYCKYEAGKGIEPLSVERHGDIVFLAHTYEQNGDLMYDPAYEFKIDTQNRTAEIISYELSGMGVYQTFDKDSPERADAENSALDLTLKNIKEYGYERTVYRGGNEKEDMSRSIENLKPIAR